MTYRLSRRQPPVHSLYVVTAYRLYVATYRRFNIQALRQVNHPCAQAGVLALERHEVVYTHGDRPTFVDDTCTCTCTCACLGGRARLPDESGDRARIAALSTATLNGGVHPLPGPDPSPHPSQACMLPTSRDTSSPAGRAAVRDPPRQSPLEAEGRGQASSSIQSGWWRTEASSWWRTWVTPCHPNLSPNPNPNPDPGPEPNPYPDPKYGPDPGPDPNPDPNQATPGSSGSPLTESMRKPPPPHYLLFHRLSCRLLRLLLHSRLQSRHLLSLLLHSLLLNCLVLVLSLLLHSHLLSLLHHSLLLHRRTIDLNFRPNALGIAHERVYVTCGNGDGSATMHVLTLAGLEL